MAEANREETTPPATYSDLKAAITARYGSLSPQLQKIAHFVLEHPHDLALETIATIAGRVEVQPSSMVRFAQAMGYDGFSDMQQVFRSHLLAGRAQSYRERIKALHETPEGAANAASILSDFVERGTASLELLREQTDPAKLGQAVELLAAASEIYLLAQRRAFPVAFYLSYALSRLERRCHLLDNVGGLLAEQAAPATPRDVIVAVSFRPYTPAVVDIVTERSEDGIPIIAVTDSPLSPLALPASLVFEIREAEPTAFRSLVAPLCLAQSLVVSLGHHLETRNGGS